MDMGWAPEISCFLGFLLTDTQETNFSAIGEFKKGASPLL